MPVVLPSQFSNVLDTCKSPLAWLIFICLFYHVANAEARPNILLIVSEDNGPELGCYGDRFVKTPNLDRLASQGTRFENAFVPQSGCSQSRAALLTGLYPHQNGQIGLATWKFAMYRANTPNIVRQLKESGYRTGILGKLHVNPATAFPFDMHEIESSNFSRKKLKAYASRAADFMRASDEPFFLSVNYPDAHRPFTKQVGKLPEQPLSGDDVKPLSYFGLDSPELRSDTANYYNCMSRLDSLVGDLLAELNQSGKKDNTLIVYMGDHGADLLRGKRTCFEGGLRVPLLIKQPGNGAAGQVRRELVSTLDIAPTLLQIANADPIKNLPGESLLPLLNGESVRWREYLFAEYHLHSAHNFYPQRCVRNGRYKLIQNLQPKSVDPGFAFTLNRFFPGIQQIIENAPIHVRNAYHRMQAPPEYQLYDLKEDPYEFQNLVNNAMYSDVFIRLKSKLAEWREQTNDPLLKAAKLQRLKTEIQSCLKNGTPSKSALNLTYSHYFFEP